MIYPSVTLEEWAKKYGLEVFDYHCPKCRNAFKTSVPVIVGEYAGLRTEIHACGEQFRELVLTPRTNEAKDLWNQVF